MNYSTPILFFALLCSAFAPASLQAQDAEPQPQSQPQPQSFEYVMIEIRTPGRSGNRLEVVVEFGQTYEQRAESLRYSRELSKLGTKGAVLNYMAEQGFELEEALVETRISRFHQGSEFSVFYFIMKRAKQSSDG